MVFIDIDGVLADSETKFRELIKNLYDIDLTEPTRTYGLTDHLTFDQVSKMLEVFYNNYVDKVEPIAGAPELMRKLMLKTDIYIVTARIPRVEALTKLWLRKKSIPYNKLFFAKNKLALAKRYKAALIVEDKPSTVQQFAKHGRDFLLMDQRYNRQENVEFEYHPSVEQNRVLNWSECYNRICEKLEQLER